MPLRGYARLGLRVAEDLAVETEAEARRLNTTKSEVARARLAGVNDTIDGEWALSTPHP